MIDTIYFEASLVDHPRVRSTFARFPAAVRVPCDKYGEVFNKRAQNFRLQKIKPALILARKLGSYVLPAPAGYAIDGALQVKNYYFSHLLNCIYDCRYCFLQGMYRSANYVLFVNYEAFQQQIAEISARAPGPCYFFSGYDCDSLALEGITGFAREFVPFFAGIANASLELRTKSVNLKSLLQLQATPNCIVAYSLTPDECARRFEHGAPPLEARIEALQRLQRAGWPVGLRFDPLLYAPDFRERYDRLFRQVFAVVDANKLHSVSLGPFRLPRAFYRNMTALYPEEALLAEGLKTGNEMVSYSAELEQEMSGHCLARLTKHVAADRLFPCEFRRPEAQQRSTSAQMAR